MKHKAHWCWSHFSGRQSKNVCGALLFIWYLKLLNFAWKKNSCVGLDLFSNNKKLFFSSWFYLKLIDVSHFGNCCVTNVQPQPSEQFWLPSGSVNECSLCFSNAGYTKRARLLICISEKLYDCDRCVDECWRSYCNQYITTRQTAKLYKLRRIIALVPHVTYFFKIQNPSQVQLAGWG